MKNEWKYKIELRDQSVFVKIEKERGNLFPEELKDFIMETNAATPQKYNFLLGNTEKVLGAILSFNQDETDADTVFSALEVIENRNLLPFAVDPFGNYICYDLETQNISFWNHETDEVLTTGKNLQEFLNALY